ncbi:MAG TPA: carbohydrate binding domain-containing protein [Hymenobacter sp.]
MQKKLIAAIILTNLSLASCSTKSETVNNSNILASSDFDNLIGWAGDLPSLATLSKVRAHSGRYSTSVQPGFDYSLGYSNALGKLVDHRPEKLTISAWVLVPNDQANARLVIEIKDPANSQGLLYDGTELRTVVKEFNNWQRIEKTITVPATAGATSNLVIYMWRADSRDPVYLDDMQIRLTK